MSYAKYRNKPTHYDGHRFDSKRELKRYQELQLLVRAGEIANLRLQVSFTFNINGKPLLIRSGGYPNGRQVRYVCDFVYEDKNGQMHYEDSKGVATDVYKLKKGLMELFHGILIEEV